MPSPNRAMSAVRNSEHVCFFLVLADTVRPASVKAFKELRDVGIEHLIMLSGDNRPTVEAVAREVGVDEIHAEVLPAIKGDGHRKARRTQRQRCDDRADQP
ncbi:MAG: HAD family hydrolase [Planctomycetales bacterium]|nr:HAD family hydrolase [Planctomycetales bacterium]